MQSTPPYIFGIFSKKGTNILYFAVANDRICITQCVLHPLKLRQIFLSKVCKVHPRIFLPFSQRRARTFCILRCLMNGFISRNACNILKIKTNILLRSMQSTPPYFFAFSRNRARKTKKEMNFCTK